MFFISGTILSLMAFVPGIVCQNRSIIYTKRIWHTGTSTPYEVIANLNANKLEISFPGYRAKKLWFVGRHGTRNPDIETLNGMFHVLPLIQEKVLADGPGNPCYSEDLKEWRPPSELEAYDKKHNIEADSATTEDKIPDLPSDKLTKDKSASPSERIPDQPKDELPKDKIFFKNHRLVKSLTTHGKTTMHGIGKRFRERFGDLIPLELDSKTEIRFTATTRTKESAYGFAIGLFGEGSCAEENPSFQELEKKDKILKFDARCDYWLKKIKRCPEIMSILNAFPGSKELRRTLKDVQTRCSLPNLTRSELMLIFTTGGYDLAWYDTSPWLKFLTEDEQEILDYAEDLKIFNQAAYGHEMNYRIACPMFMDMFNFLNADSGAMFRFNFTHIKSLIKFSAHLHLYHESGEMLTADNFKPKSQREWASSRFAGFSFNITFVSYEPTNDSGEPAILLLVNEHPTKIPRCTPIGDTYLCSQKEFEEIFKSSIHECHFDEWCAFNEDGPMNEDQEESPSSSIQ